MAFDHLEPSRAAGLADRQADRKKSVAPGLVEILH